MRRVTADDVKYVYVCEGEVRTLACRKSDLGVTRKQLKEERVRLDYWLALVSVRK